MAQHLKLIALLIFTLSASYTSAQSLRNLLDRPYGIIESKWEKDAQGATELNYYNEDYCDYYLYRANDRSYNLSNGKNTIFKIEKNAQVDNPFKSASSYTFYRGKFPKDFNIQTPYALPVKNNQKTAWKTDPREPFKTLNFHIKQGDTIYATRSGIACKTTNPQQLLIYHELSHHFVSQILGKRPPSWLNEGLSEYFKHCTIHKKAVRHTFTEYEQGRVRTMYMLGEVNLPTFLNSSQGKFMKQQMTDEQYSYILSHALVTFWIESVPREIFKKFISVLQNKNDPSTVSEQINLVYPGGFQQFEKDFEAVYK